MGNFDIYTNDKFFLYSMQQPWILTHWRGRSRPQLEYNALIILTLDNVELIVIVSHVCIGHTWGFFMRAKVI